MRRALRLALICFTFACVRATDTSVDERTHSVPASRLIRVGSGVSLEIVDWGGRGPSLVFLAGLGSTAHVFDEFAPQFTDSFHVVGLTRRGFGASAGSLPPTDLDTLVGDIRAILDTLDLHSVTLVGHSIAGEEMTRFGDVDATRCAALIYLDAAYDRTPQPNINAPSMPLPPPRAYAATYAAWQAYRKRVMAFKNPNPRFEQRRGSTRRVGTLAKSRRIRPRRGSCAPFASLDTREPVSSPGALRRTDFSNRRRSLLRGTRFHGAGTRRHVARVRCVVRRLLPHGVRALSATPGRRDSRKSLRVS